MYLDYCSSTSETGRFLVNSFDTTLKIPESFPIIFCDEVTRIGCIALEPMLMKTGTYRYSIPTTFGSIKSIFIEFVFL